MCPCSGIPLEIISFRQSSALVAYAILAVRTYVRVGFVRMAAMRIGLRSRGEVLEAWPLVGMLSVYRRIAVCGKSVLERDSGEKPNGETASYLSDPERSPSAASRIFWAVDRADDFFGYHLGPHSRPDVSCAEQQAPPLRGQFLVRAWQR